LQKRCAGDEETTPRASSFQKPPSAKARPCSRVPQKRRWGCLKTPRLQTTAFIPKFMGVQGEDEGRKRKRQPSWSKRGLGGGGTGTGAGLNLERQMISEGGGQRQVSPGNLKISLLNVVLDSRGGIKGMTLITPCWGKNMGNRRKKGPAFTV